MATKKKKKKAPPKSFEFDLGKFQAAQFERRTAEVPVPDMRDFFPKGTAPVLLVQNLTYLELAQSDQEVALNREAQVEAEGQALQTKAVQALRTLLRAHVGEETPDMYVKTLHMVHKGLAKPEMEYEDVLKFANVFPIEFKLCWLKINELTSKGQELLGKQKDSGQNLES